VIASCSSAHPWGAWDGLRPGQSRRDGAGAAVADADRRLAARGRATTGWAMDRLHAKGYISDPKSKAKSVVLSEEGERLSRKLFERHFARKG